MIVNDHRLVDGTITTEPVQNSQDLCLINGTNRARFSSDGGDPRSQLTVIVV
jgi:hypothetical protein